MTGGEQAGNLQRQLLQLEEAPLRNLSQFLHLKGDQEVLVEEENQKNLLQDATLQIASIPAGVGADRLHRHLKLQKRHLVGD